MDKHASTTNITGLATNTHLSFGTSNNTSSELGSMSGEYISTILRYVQLTYKIFERLKLENLWLFK
jgi:hypothetical protein